MHLDEEVMVRRAEHGACPAALEQAPHVPGMAGDGLCVAVRLLDVAHAKLSSLRVGLVHHVHALLLRPLPKRDAHQHRHLRLLGERYAKALRLPADGLVVLLRLAVFIGIAERLDAPVSGLDVHVLAADDGRSAVRLAVQHQLLRADVLAYLPYLDVTRTGLAPVLELLVRVSSVAADHDVAAVPRRVHHRHEHPPGVASVRVDDSRDAACPLRGEDILRQGLVAILLRVADSLYVPVADIRGLLRRWLLNRNGALRPIVLRRLGGLLRPRRLTSLLRRLDRLRRLWAFALHRSLGDRLSLGRRLDRLQTGKRAAKRVGLLPCPLGLRGVLLPCPFRIGLVVVQELLKPPETLARLGPRDIRGGQLLQLAGNLLPRVRELLPALLVQAVVPLKPPLLLNHAVGIGRLSDRDGLGHADIGVKRLEPLALCAVLLRKLPHAKHPLEAATACAAQVSRVLRRPAIRMEPGSHREASHSGVRHLHGQLLAVHLLPLEELLTKVLDRLAPCLAEALKTSGGKCLLDRSENGVLSLAAGKLTDEGAQPCAPHLLQHGKLEHLRQDFRSRVHRDLRADSPAAQLIVL